MKLEALASPLRDEAMTNAPAIDLDACANTMPTSAVIDAVAAAMSSRHGNPSSGHARGDESRVTVESARDALAGLVTGAFEDGVIFTSGCTEANNLVLSSFAGEGAWIVTSAVEHPSVLATAMAIADAGGAVFVLPVDRHGRIDPGELERSIPASGDPGLVSIQIANSETGVIQDVEAIAKIVRGLPDVYFHADAAQAIGKIDVMLGQGIGPDVVTMSGHKIHAPMGVGAVIVADGSDIPLRPLQFGGEQEQGLRAGTQPLPAIAGLGAACREWAFDRTGRRSHLAALQRRFERGLGEIGDIVINGWGAPRLPNVSSVTFRGCDGMALVANLDARGIRASQGSACSSRRPEPSSVLRAMGLGEADAFSTVRFSFSILNTIGQIDSAVATIAESVAQLRGWS